jgi:ABC-2 type transport system ATP-binding protein
VLRSGQIPVEGGTDELLAGHKILTGPPPSPGSKIAGVDKVVSVSRGERQSTLLVRTNGEVTDPAWGQHDVSLEDLVLAYLERPRVEAVVDRGGIAP